MELVRTPSMASSAIRASLISVKLMGLSTLVNILYYIWITTVQSSLGPKYGSYPSNSSPSKNI